MASKAKSGKSKTQAKKAAKKSARGKPVKKAAKKAVKKAVKKSVKKKPSKKPAKKAGKRAAGGNKQRRRNVKSARKPAAAKKSAAKSPGKKPSMTQAKPAKIKPAKAIKEVVAAGIAPTAPAPAKARATGVAEEPADVDEYETQRLAAVEPFKRSGAAPKPGAAGRLFDDEAELEDYDPLFDEVKEEDE